MTVDHKAISITRCTNCGEIIHKVTAEGIIGKPNGHKCKKTYEQLLDENERLKHSENFALEQKEKAWEAFKIQAKGIEQLQADKAAAVEALRWYADRGNYRYKSLDSLSKVECDLGEYARVTIRRLEGGIT